MHTFCSVVVHLLNKPFYLSLHVFSIYSSLHAFIHHNKVLFMGYVVCVYLIKLELNRLPAKLEFYKFICWRVFVSIFMRH